MAFPGAAQEEKPAEWQGKRIGSLNEWWLIKAALKLGWRNRFDFQVPFFGGFRAGGTVIDFVFGTTPKPTPLYYDGEFFHNPNTDSKEFFVRLTFNVRTRGRYQMGPDGKPWALYGQDVEDEETALISLREIIGRAQ